MDALLAVARNQAALAVAFLPGADWCLGARRIQ
jgi:hypothetical protein